MPTLVQPGQQASNGTGATSFTILNNQQLDVAGLEGKDPQGQLEDLQSQLARENRIREGAENLLNMQLADNLRLKVESELDLARSKIEAIAKRIDIESSRKKSKTRNMTERRR